MRLKLITLAIISINVILTGQDIPTNVMAYVIGTLLLSMIVTGKTVRTVCKILILLGSMVLLRYHFKTLLVTECGVSFVMILSALKFWELDNERDHFNMFLILSLAECCIFLLNPSFILFSLGMIKMIFYFYYILKIRNYDISLLNPKRLALLITPSIIFSLVLFYTFPRFTQGFINTSEMQYIIAGGNSRIDFKQLGPLSVSSEQAFKVYGLENSGLPFKLLYWRSAVLWQLNSEEWTSSNGNLKQAPTLLEQPKLKYDVEVFHNLKEYLPVLDGNSSVTYSSLPFNSYSDGSYRLKTISRANLAYTIVGNYGDRQKAASSFMLKKGLRLKSKRKEEVAKFFFANATNSESDEERLRELIQIFKKRDFQYSTTPPMYNSLEDFLLSGTTGYCSHFAAAFTYMARLYNLPARMVVGYLGGEFNPYDNSVIVKEMDAHAWSEVYMESRGWVKVDPTSLVAPERIAMSADEFNNRLNPYISIFNLKIDRSLFSSQLLNNASLWIDSLNSKFNTNIFNFDRDKQMSFLRSLTPGNLSVGWIFAIALSLSMTVFWLVFYFYGKRRVDPRLKRYLKFNHKMQGLGLTKHTWETASEFRSRAKEQIPHEAHYIDREIDYYIDSFYK